MPAEQQPGPGSEPDARPAPGRPVVSRGVQDAAIAVGVALLDLSSGFGAGRQGHHQGVLATALLTAMGLILFARRRFPGTVVAVMAALVAWLTLLNTSLEAAFIAVLIASYSAAVYGSRLVARVLAVAAAVALLGVGIPTMLGWGSWSHARSPVPTVLAAAGAWLVGLVVRKQFAVRAEHIAALAERAELIASQQEERARRATLAERLRIARELHDIVAHHLSVVVIQAQAAQRIADRDPDRAKTAMADVERTGRTALEEMRRLLGLLRTGEPDTPEPGTLEPGTPEPGSTESGGTAPDVTFGPSLGLADVDNLAERMRGAGLPVTISKNGDPRDVPEDVGLTVYRIVQEALTNVLKHAGPAQATVQLTFAGDLSVDVADDGWGAAAHLNEPAAPGAGHGTAGMRERVTALGGQLTAGPRAGGGYRVLATIPLATIPLEETSIVKQEET
jgi:signal transduction histidine kinase